MGRARPASERIPNAARLLDVSVTSEEFGEDVAIGRTSRTISKPRAVHRIAALIDGLPVFQPGAVKPCGVSFGGPLRIVRLTFRASPHGPPLAQATEQFPACPPPVMALRIRGRPQPPLERSGVVFRSLKTLLG